MRNIVVLFIFLISFYSYSQIPPDIHPGGVIIYDLPEVVTTDSLLTFDTTGRINKISKSDIGIPIDVVPRDSLIVQSPQSFGNIYHYWVGTEAQMDSILGLDPNFFDDMLWICTDCPQQGGGGTADQFVMGDSSFKDFIDDDTFASATSTNIPSAESVKAYVDASATSITSGPFTPTMYGSSGSAVYSFTSSSRYYKVGKLVHVEINLSSISNTGTPGGFLFIGNLPYPVEHISSLSLSTVSGFGTNFYSIGAEALDEASEGSVVMLTIQTSLDSTQSYAAAASFTSGVLRIAGTYITQ